jgi:hypothetical protein
VDEVLNGLLAPANIRRGFFDCEEPGWHLWPAVMLLEFRNDPCRNLRC